MSDLVGNPEDRFSCHGLYNYVHVQFFLYIGAVAGIIDIGASWLSDVKEGVCRDAFWLNKEQCCWSANDTALDNYDRCKQVMNKHELNKDHVVLGLVVWLAYSLLSNNTYVLGLIHLPSNIFDKNFNVP